MASTSSTPAAVAAAAAAAAASYFPPELIPEVARRLTNLQDLFALRAVCRTYRALLPLTSSNLASQAPLLLVPLEDGSKALFHPTLRLIHRFCLHLMARAGTDWRITRFHACGNQGRVPVWSGTQIQI